MTVTHHAPATLRPHPLNEQVYDADRDAEALRASIAEHGILTPLVIDQHGTILSGHRRWQAARALGLDRVPVVVRHVDESLVAELVLLESNRQREKTYSERMREAEHLERIVAERNRRRMLAGKAADPLPTLVGGAGDTRTVAQVAEAVGLKRETYRKVRRVYDTAAGKPGADGNPPPAHAQRVAAEQMAALDRGDTTPHAASQAVGDAITYGDAARIWHAIYRTPLTNRAALEELFGELHAAIPSLPHEGRVWVAKRARQYEQQARDVQQRSAEHLVREHGLRGAAHRLSVAPRDLRAILEGRDEEVA